MRIDCFLNAHLTHSSSRLEFRNRARREALQGRSETRTRSVGAIATSILSSPRRKVRVGASTCESRRTQTTVRDFNLFTLHFDTPTERDTWLGFGAETTLRWLFRASANVHCMAHEKRQTNCMHFSLITLFNKVRITTTMKE